MPGVPFGPLMFPGPDQGKHDHVELCVSHVDVVWPTHQGVRVHSDSFPARIYALFLVTHSVLSIPMCMSPVATGRHYVTIGQVT